MPNFRERTRIRRAQIAAGSPKDLSTEHQPRPIVPQPSFTSWPVRLPSPPPVEGDAETIVITDEATSAGTVAVIETTSAEVTVAELEAMTYDKLRGFLKENDLSTAGKKADLLSRAIEFAEGEPIE